MPRVIAVADSAIAEHDLEPDATPGPGDLPGPGEAATLADLLGPAASPQLQAALRRG